MLQPLLNGTTIPLLEKVAAFAERRQEVLAGNIANFDTPDYKMRDLPVAEFQNSLRAAIAGRGPEASLGSQTVSSSSLETHFPRELFHAVEAPAANITFQDANNRSIERQMMELTKNSMMQNFAIELIVAQMNQLQAVISERP